VELIQLARKSAQVWLCTMELMKFWEHFQAPLKACNEGCSSILVENAKLSVAVYTTTHTLKDYSVGGEASRILDLQLSRHEWPAWRFGCFIQEFGFEWGTRWRSWLRHNAASLNVAGSVPDEVIGFLN
jgi:hypothetical protein